MLPSGARSYRMVFGTVGTRKTDDLSPKSKIAVSSPPNNTFVFFVFVNARTVMSKARALQFDRTTVISPARKCVADDRYALISRKKTTNATILFVTLKDDVNSMKLLVKRV